VNKHGDPIFLLQFFNVHNMNVNYANFQKSLIVEQYQLNYPKGEGHSKRIFFVIDNKNLVVSLATHRRFSL